MEESQTLVGAGAEEEQNTTEEMPEQEFNGITSRKGRSRFRFSQGR